MWLASTNDADIFGDNADDQNSQSVGQDSSVNTGTEIPATLPGEGSPGYVVGAMEYHKKYFQYLTIFFTSTWCKDKMYFH